MPPDEDGLIERAQVPLDVHSGKDQDGKMGAATYSERGGTKEAPTQTGSAFRTHHDEIGLDLARHSEDFVMDRLGAHGYTHV
jgi:hypothetical protein